MPPTAACQGASALAFQDFIDPVANAGTDRYSMVGVPVQLNASASTDDVGIVNYTWTFDDGEPRTLYGRIANYSFWNPGVYNVTLNVSDAEDNWDLDYVLVTVRIDTFPPISNPRVNKTAFVGTLITLNGTASRDPAGVIVNYTWRFNYSGQQVELYGPVHKFWFNQTGKYNITLIVTDGGGLTDVDYAILKVSKPPTWLEENWLRLLIGGTVIGIIAAYAVPKYLKNKTLVTKTDIDKLRLMDKRFRKLWKVFIATWMGKIGIGIIIFFLFIVLLANVAYPDNPKSPEVNYAPRWWAELFYGPLDGSIDEPIRTTTKVLGTDQTGEDIMIRTLHGTQASLLIGFTAMAISMGIGTLVGLASGYWGGWRDEVIMRVNDVFLSIPWLVLMIVIAAIWGAQNLGSVIAVIGLTGWSTTARIVRAQVLSLKMRSFVERSKAVGAGDWHIIGRHIFPNVVPLIFANAILTIAISILSESTLSFLGLGPQDVETWGRVLEDAYNQGVALIPAQSLFLIVPGLCIVFVVLGFTFIGYAMDEVLNPKLRKR